MEITIEQENSVRIIALSGRLDILHAEAFENTIVEHIDNLNENKMLIDCENLSFISSAGLRVFMIALKKMKAKLGKLVLTGMNESNRKVFQITGYEKLFTIAESREEGLSLFYLS
ncbi:MAG: STAS domain-containing protein [Ignavibacteriaceae bacterium]|nr:STAS domain-containing protein [Ignavibacteriaceae bacterium]